MNAMKRSMGRVGLALTGACAGLLTGCATHTVHERVVYVPAPQPPVLAPARMPEPPPPVVVAPPPAVIEVPPPDPEPVVQVRVASDFYEPLTPYGRWVDVGNYGRCWVPANVDTAWRPYASGHWQRTDAGWYWVSDEPWGWATYHYGRWDFTPEYGWVWVPQTQWAPAWVSWREGGGYVGWAPMRPSVSINVNIGHEDYDRDFVPRAYVFVDRRKMLQPVQPRTVIINNTTVVSKTVNITNVKVVNKTVINEGPRAEIVEKSVGHKVPTVPVNEFRRKQEEVVVAEARKKNPPKNTRPEVRNEASAPVIAPPPVAHVPEKQVQPIAGPRQALPAKRDNQPVIGAHPTPTQVAPAPVAEKPVATPAQQNGNPPLVVVPSRQPNKPAEKPEVKHEAAPVKPPTKVDAVKAEHEAKPVKPVASAKPPTKPEKVESKKQEKLEEKLQPAPKAVESRPPVVFGKQAVPAQKTSAGIVRQNSPKEDARVIEHGQPKKEKAEKNNKGGKKNGEGEDKGEKQQ